MESISAVDMATLAILALAILRGLFIGLIREVFSLVGLAAACVAVRFATAPVADWAIANLPLEMSPLAAKIAAGVGIAVAIIVTTAVVGRLIRRGVRWVGLGFADRLGGGVVGAAEGALVVVVLMLIGIAVVGRDRPPLADSRTLAAFESAERMVANAEPPAVASPPPDPGS